MALGRSAVVRGGFVERQLAMPGTGFGRATEKPLRVRPPDPVDTWTTATYGTSAQGVPLERWDLRPEAPTRRVVVICGVHGDERAGLELAAGCSQVLCPDDLHLTILPLANPDGWEAGSRHNARGVDINRNFAWGWQPTLHSGGRPESEPETAALVALLKWTNPDLVIWVHQPLGYVAALDGCPPGYADLWSEVSGVPVRTGLRQVGGGESWTAFDLKRPSMLIEVGGTRDLPVGVDQHVRALERLLPFVVPVG